MKTFKLNEMPEVDDFWLGVEEVRPLPGSYHEWCQVCHPRRLPDDVLALLKPCECWDKEGRHFNPFCEECIDGRPKFQIVVPCPECEANYRAMVTREMHRCDGTVSRTFTVTGDEPLLVVVGVHFQRPEVRRFISFRARQWQWIDRDTGECRDVTLVGATEATTHALHVRAVPS